jgi:hypothetical protein
LYQRIEQLIGKRLPKFDVVEEEVMMLVERVTEAQRIAKMVSEFILFCSEFILFVYNTVYHK